MISIQAGESRHGKNGEANLLCAFDLRWVVWVVVVDGEGELERAGLVHSCRVIGSMKVESQYDALQSDERRRLVAYPRQARLSR